MNRLLVIIALVFMSSASHALDLADTEATRKLSDNAATLIGEGKLKEAYETLKPYWAIPDHEVDAIIYQTETQRGPIATRFGKSLSIEHIKTESIGDVFVRHIYLERFEKHALAWIFMYYRPKDRWLVNAVIYSPEIGMTPKPLFE